MNTYTIERDLIGYALLGHFTLLSAYLTPRDFNIHEHAVLWYAMSRVWRVEKVRLDNVSMYLHKHYKKEEAQKYLDALFNIFNTFRVPKYPVTLAIELVEQNKLACYA